MSLETLNTIASLTTVGVVAATAIAALVQLRHLRSANQINAMLSIINALDAKSVQDALILIHQKLGKAIEDPAFRELVIARARSQSLTDANPEYSDLVQAVRQVGNAYEELGIMVKRGIVETDIFLDRYSWAVLQTWKEMELVIGLIREAIGVNSIWENFEYLAVISEDYLRQHPSSYPTGVRRMEIRIPWPVSPADA